MSNITAITTSELASYKGACHCKAVTFTVRIQSLSELGLNSCNCSICSRNGYLMVYPDPSNVDYHTGLDNITEYRFSTTGGPHKFCKTCGSSIGVEWQMGDKKMIAMNVSALRFTLPIYHMLILDMQIDPTI